ncbi:hypothetical protein QTP86_034249 [Hemibagrus guttatus]|nr:hypothetical protein QTP86_034249 [Hemibagrus guttatus]
MQGKHASKMPLGIAVALLLTVQLVSTQTSYPNNEELTPLPVSRIPDELKRVNGVLPVKDPGTSSGSMTYSGDGEFQDVSQTVKTVTGQYDNNMKTTPLPETTVISDPSSHENDMSKTVTPNPSLEPATTSDSHVNLPGTNTIPSPGNSTTAATTTTYTTANVTSTAASNNTQNSTTAVSGNFTTNTTSPPQVTNDTISPSENSTNTTVSTTTTVQTSASTNGTGGLFDFRGNMDKGLSSDIQQQSKSQAWGAILGIGVGVAIVALVVYIIVKRRNYRGFSHSKLVEDMPPEPVLRLDNNEPLDLKFDGFAYYNPGLQADNIQMTNFPQGRTN